MFIHVAPTGTPKNLNVTALGQNELYVRWSAPDDDSVNGELRYYIIIYCTLNNKAVCNTTNVTGDMKQIKLPDLMIDTMYNVSVAAYTIEVGPFASKRGKTGQM